MAIGRFLMVACFSARLSVRRSLPCFDGLKLNLLSPNLLMAKLLMEIGLNPTLPAGVTTSPIKTKKRSQERVKV
jgi:hypothetical protein